MIDSHFHLGALPFKGEKWGSLKEYQQIAKSIGIEKYCAVPIGLPENFTDKTTPDNASVLKASEKDKKIIPVYWFNVFDLPEKIDSRYKAIKFHSDIGQVSIDDERVVNFVNKIELPVFVHTNEGKDYSTLGTVINLAKQVKVPVIAVHSGSLTKTFFKLNDYQFPKNVFFEISGIQYALILKKIYKMAGADKILLGSDYPFGDVRVGLGMLESLDLTKSEKEKITKRNLEKLLRLK